MTTTQSLAERLEEKTALSKLEQICAEIYDAWDKDQRPGKLLLALAGLLPNYRQDVDDVRSALRSRDSVIEAPAAYLLENRAYGKELSFKPLDAMRGPGWGQTPLYALSSHAETAGGWRPIETAPKDGTSILGAYFNQPRSESHREGRIVTCWYQQEFESFISGCREMTLARGYTFEDGTSRQLHSPDKEDITHWMPLPPPPQDRALKAAGGEM